VYNADTPRVIWSTVGDMTSFTKPEVHNVLHCRQRRIEPLPQVTCTENFASFGHEPRDDKPSLNGRGQRNVIIFFILGYYDIFGTE